MTTGVGRERSCDLVSLPVLGYTEALDLQYALVAARVDGRLERDVLLILEHPAVFTLGRRGGQDNLGVSRSFLRRKAIPLVHVERGGDITYHGPGQLVIYPIVNLRQAGCRVVDFVSGLEEVMVRVLAHWGIAGQPSAVNRGVWVGPAKIGSVGVAIRRSVSFHGLALNANTDLDPFQWINPCGLTGITVTSMQQELGRKVDMDQVRREAGEAFGTVFGMVPVARRLEDLRRQLGAVQGRSRTGCRMSAELRVV